MSDFKKRMAYKQAADRMKDRQILGTLKKAAIGAAVVFGAFLCTGYYDGPQELVEEVYTVKPGDTFWAISEEYCEKNTGGRRYILEFQEGIKELNPWLLETKCQLQPGDKIRINYWIKKEN